MYCTVPDMRWVVQEQTTNVSRSTREETKPAETTETARPSRARHPEWRWGNFKWYTSYFDASICCASIYLSVIIVRSGVRSRTAPAFRDGREKLRYIPVTQFRSLN